MTNDDDDLFRAFARGTDLGTSHEAARSLGSDALARLMGTVYSAARGRRDHGATCGEICEITGLDWNTVSPRLKPLCELKLLASRKDDEGKIIKRVAKSGRRQTVWFAA
jgi:hypothetical protein